ncbi:MAG: FAD-dependent thymidylate synthase [Desulfuromonadales bacterium]|nr:FAD-dependent thymidylate synthase [Desulfuromonadales bacterium]
MLVQRLTHTLQPEPVAATATRLFCPSAAVGRPFDQSCHQVAILLRKTLDHGQFSALAHVIFSSGIKSINCDGSQQLNRHRSVAGRCFSNRTVYQ